MAEAPEGLVELLPAYLARQRWYAGAGEPDPATIEVVDAGPLCTTGDGHHLLHWLLVRVGTDLYQLLVGQRPLGEPADFLNAHEGASIGTHGGVYYYDGTLDPELSLELLAVVTAGVELANWVRPIGVEQSNTSLVFDDRIIVKLFRRLGEGPNPDVVVTNALATAGFDHVAAPVATWRSGGRDLAFAQRFLAGGTEGWALALTSLRDLYNGDIDAPDEAGGDFAGEARRLGRVTAELHLAMSEVWGSDAERLRTGDWAALVDDIERRLRPLAARPSSDAEDSETDAAAPTVVTADAVDAAMAALRDATDPGPAQRVHGDYHLGQVMRTDGGWYVLDFEGEPARASDERLRPASPLKDVTGMLRSIDYAARFALGERSEPALAARADAWEAHNRDAFLAGYRATAGVGSLIPSGAPFHLALSAYELDKALYELDYERSYRPTWAAIPAGAITRIVARLS